MNKNDVIKQPYQSLFFLNECIKFEIKSSKKKGVLN